MSDDTMIVNVFLNGPRKAYCQFGYIQGERFMEMGYDYDYCGTGVVEGVSVSLWRLTPESTERFRKELP